MKRLLLAVALFTFTAATIAAADTRPLSSIVFGTGVITIQPVLAMKPIPCPESNTHQTETPGIAHRDLLFCGEPIYAGPLWKFVEVLSSKLDANRKPYAVKGEWTFILTEEGGMVTVSVQKQFGREHSVYTFPIEDRKIEEVATRAAVELMGPFKK